MELTNPSTGTVTNGLLATELITGKLQAGDNTFQQLQPAGIPVAGDPNNAGPTYAQIGASGLTTAAASAVGQPTTRALSSAGAPGTFAAGAATRTRLLPPSTPRPSTTSRRHSMTTATRRGCSRSGLAIAEPFWANGVLVGGQPKDVLVQAFERRVLTYTPSNPDAFKVEFGNIGAHYYTWRYVTNAGGTGTHGHTDHDTDRRGTGLDAPDGHKRHPEPGNHLIHDRCRVVWHGGDPGKGRHELHDEHR